MTPRAFLKYCSCIVAVGALLVIPASCSSTSPPTTGTLIGTIVGVHSSAPTQRSGYQTGLVTVRGSRGAAGQANVTSPGQTYRFRLRRGLYLMQAQPPGLPADACKGAANVFEGHTTRADVVCTLPT